LIYIDRITVLRKAFPAFLIVFLELTRFISPFKPGCGIYPEPQISDIKIGMISPY